MFKYNIDTRIDIKGFLIFKFFLNKNILMIYPKLIKILITEKQLVRIFNELHRYF